jgi:hypothetical protein
MNRFASSRSRRITGLAACVAAAALGLAACNSHSGGSGSTGSGGSGSGGSSAGASTTPVANNSSNPGTGTGGSTSVVSASSEPFPIAVGNTWVYKVTTLGGLKSTDTNKVVAVTPVAGGNEATLSDTESLNGKTTEIQYIFHSDGSITYPSTQLGSTATIVKGSIVWPPASVIASGQETHSTVEIAADAGTTKINETAHITVKGDGTATVTVPAGTYSTTVVQMTETYTISGYTGTIVVKTWVAAGVGPVQSEAILEELGHSETVSHQELVSFTKG